MEESRVMSKPVKVFHEHNFSKRSSWRDSNIDSHKEVSAEGKKEKLCMDHIMVNQKLVEVWLDCQSPAPAARDVPQEERQQAQE